MLLEDASANALTVTTHVGRDVLAQAAQFKTEAAVVWEYVVNSLQYVDPGTQPRVEVTLKRDGITISDNGTGMDEDRLRHFFTMHGENLERRAGRVGRGKWGTGKSAAFGIANRLRVDTIHNSLRNIVELQRSVIETSQGEAIPVVWRVRNEAALAPNGTVVTISDLNLPRLDKTSVIEYIERNLSAFRGNKPIVAVNAHICEYHAPAVSETYMFEPSDKQASTLGSVILSIHASTTPLRQWEQGITIMAGSGNLVAIGRGGIEHNEFGNYLFGEIEVPSLETYESPIEPYDASRSLMLNPRHPVVATLVGFIGSKLEHVRQLLVTRERSAREAEEARRLAKHADALAEVLNRDFVLQSTRLRDIRAATSRPGSASSFQGGGGRGDSETDFWIEGLDEPGDVDAMKSSDKVGQGEDRPAPQVPRVGSPDDEGQSLVSPAGGEGRRPRPRGGLVLTSEISVWMRIGRSTTQAT